VNVAAILKQLFAAYPNTAISEATVAMYLRMLQDIPPAQLQLAVDQAVATSKFPPTVAELRDVLRNLQTPDKPSWIEGWEEVTRQLSKVGRYGKPEFSSELTARVVKSLGWRAMCDCPVEDLGIYRAQFRDAFNAYQGKEDSQAKLLPHVRQAIEAGQVAPKLLTVDELVKIAKGKVNRA